MQRIALLVMVACGGGKATVKNTNPTTCDAKTCVELGDRAIDAHQASQALEYYVKACDLNVGIGCGNAAMMMVSGEGTKVDVPAGWALMVKGCELDDSRSCNNAGAAWSEGTNGATSVDHGKARVFYEKACTLQNGFGCFNLGNVFRLGEGVPTDLKRAFDNFKRSCDLEDAKGCTELAILYVEGEVVPTDLKMALTLLDKGCKLGSAAACKNLEILKNSKP